MPDMNSTQIAVLMERIEHIVKGMDDIRPLVAAVSALQHEKESLNQQVRQLTINSETRSKLLHDIDKRVLVMERWHKARLSFSATAIAVVMALAGYTKNFIETVQDERNNTNQRLSMLELVVNSPNYAKALERREEKEVQQ